MEGLDLILPYVNIGFLAVLGLFILFGVLFGLGRGFKRSLIRLATVVGFLLLAFFLTPFTAQWVFSWHINIAGNTPVGWVDELVQRLQDTNTVGYLAPVMPYLGDFIVALALAVVNIVLFLVLYLIVKPLSWIVYAIIARFAAPKKDADGNKIKKHAWAGALIGLVQGLVLFFFFMLPFNGLLGIVNQVATYEPVNNEPAQTQSVSAAADEDAADDSVDYDVLTVAKQMNGATAVYTGILRYTGMEFLTKHAFTYETMVRLEGGTKIKIRDDLATGIELVSDVLAFSEVINRIDTTDTETGDIWLALQELTPADYAAARNIVNKFFSLNILQLGDVIIGDLDAIMAEDFGKDGVMLDNSHIYRDSSYGVLTELFADANHRDQFLVGLKAMIGYIADQKLGMVRNDLVNLINLGEKLYTLTIDTDDGEQPIMVAITRPNMPTDAMIDRLLTTVGENDLRVDPKSTVFDVLFDSYLSLSAIQMMGAKGAENFILYSNFFDNLNNDSVVGLSDFARTFTSGFFGDKALVKNQDPQKAGHWYKLKEMVKSVLCVVRDHYNISDELDRITEELRAEQTDESMLQMQAIVRYIAKLTDDEIDNLATGLHHAVFMFTEVTEFLNNQIPNLPLGDFKDVFTTLLSTDDEEVWKSTLKGLKDTMVILDKAAGVIKDITDMLQNGESTIEDILDALVGNGSESPGLNPDDVADLVYEILQIEDVGDALDKVLQNLDLGEYADEVQEQVDALKDFLNNFDATGKTPEEIEQQKEKLREIFGDIWEGLRGATRSEGLAA